MENLLLFLILIVASASLGVSVFTLQLAIDIHRRAIESTPRRVMADFNRPYDQPRARATFTGVAGADAWRNGDDAR